MRLTEFLVPFLCALKFIILVYTNCYSKTIKLPTPQNNCRFQTQELKMGPFLFASIDGHQ